jgi:PhzF family phenazine biosynthesis protein
MKIPIYQVDAFAGKLFAGNPAAVCPLENWLDDSLMQNIAAENNLAETAFFVKKEDHFKIRWFTPASEINLCGHATLASGHVLFSHLGYQGEKIRFTCKSGELFVTKSGDLLSLNFPSAKPAPIDMPPGLSEALGLRPSEILKARDIFAVYQNADDILALRPNFEQLARLDFHGFIVTAPGKDCDFVSRFFAPGIGINEDPVTGSSHTSLIPFWSARLGKKKMFARQFSKRGGELFCEDLGERVLISGKTVTYMKGEIEI